MLLKFWDEAFASAVYLINKTPSKMIQFVMPLERLFTPNQITLPCISLAAHASQVSGHTILKNLSFIPSNAPFLAIALCTKGSSV
jgi:hypothetical protein